AAGQQLDGAEDGKAGADEGEELLVEDEKGLQLDLLGLACAGQQTARLHRVDVVSSLGETRAQLFFGGCRVRLLLHLATLIRQSDYKLSHRITNSILETQTQIRQHIAAGQREASTRSTAKALFILDVSRADSSQNLFRN